jgi:hypothetical protein
MSSRAEVGKFADLPAPKASRAAQAEAALAVKQKQHAERAD